MSSVSVLRHMVKEEEKTLDTIFGIDVKTGKLDLFGKTLEVKMAALMSRYTIPWVLNNQSCGCMRCDKKFGVLRWKHHCRSCGYLVCHGCSPNVTIISELNESKGSRTCKACLERTKMGSIVDVPLKKEAESPGSDSVATDVESLVSNMS